MYLLDTNVISELRKGKKADARVKKWAGSVSSFHLFISAITVLELEQGVLHNERSDSKQGAVLRAWLASRVLPAFADRVLYSPGQSFFIMLLRQRRCCYTARPDYYPTRVNYMKIMISALCSIGLLLALPAMAQKPDMAGKGKQTEARQQAQQKATSVKDEVRDEEQVIVDNAEAALEQAEEAANSAKEGRDKAAEAPKGKMEGVQKNMDKGSQKGQEKRKENAPWWNFWSE